MYLATVSIRLELEPEVTSHDRERLLRAIRDKIKQKFAQRVTTKGDGESLLLIAFFDEGYSRARSRCDELVECVEATGQARIANVECQVFMWFEGKFRETHHDDLDEEEDENPKQNMRRNQDEMIKYSDDDEPEKRAPIPSRFGRRAIRTSGSR